MISIREMAMRALRLHRDPENQAVLDHLNLLRTQNAHDNALGRPFTGMEAARLRFLKHRYAHGELHD